jgi:hypothetical protein
MLLLLVENANNSKDRIKDRGMRYSSRERQPSPASRAATLSARDQNIDIRHRANAWNTPAIHRREEIVQFGKKMRQQENRRRDVIYHSLSAPSSQRLSDRRPPRAICRTASRYRRAKRAMETGGCAFQRHRAMLHLTVPMDVGR